MRADANEKILKRVESLLRDAEGCANQCLSSPQRERGLDREIMALAIQEALVAIRTSRS